MKNSAIKKWFEKIQDKDVRMSGTIQHFENTTDAIQD